MPFTIVRQDITKMKVDAIVNAANTDLLMGGGVCGAIFKAAGAKELQNACDKVSPIETGGAAITLGFKLPCKYVIHAAGPVYSRQNAAQSEKLLRSAYLSSLKLAAEHKCKSVAFPLISSGIYGYPKDEALTVACSAIRDFLFDRDMDVYLAVFDAALAENEQGMTEKPNFKPGIYRHYKGNNYELISVATHSETREPMVVYRALYGEFGLWVRPASMWSEPVNTPEGTVSRFTYIGEKE